MNEIELALTNFKIKTEKKGPSRSDGQISRRRSFVVVYLKPTVSQSCLVELSYMYKFMSTQMAIAHLSHKEIGVGAI